MLSKNTSVVADTQQSLPPSDKGVVRGALGLAAIALVGVGLIYPLAAVGVGQLAFPDTANGSLVMQGGKIVGSSLVAQPFADARYFQSRESAAEYDTMALSGSNLARTNPELRQRIAETTTAVAQREGVDPALIPSDMVTQSGGGIDPHISPLSAAIQVKRVAQARGVESSVVEALVAQHTAGKQLGVLGQPRVNVLELNVALDALSH